MNTDPFEENSLNSPSFSSGSYEQSPRFLTSFGRERYGARRCDSESSITDIVPKVEVELQLKENLADAMLEMPSSGSNLAGRAFCSLENEITAFKNR